MDELYSTRQLNEQFDKEIEYMTDRYSQETITTVAKWADETFGPTTPYSALERALHEIDELTERWALPLVLRDEKKLVEEAADVCITLYRYIYLVDPEAINKKMALNRKRKWKVTGEGVGQHYDERETNP